MSNVEIGIVDYDNVEISNLCRQLFFSIENLGEAKVDVIGRLANIRGRYIQKYKMKVQQMNTEDFNSYNILISTLDNVESRMDLNFMFHQSNAMYLIDCGTEMESAHCKLVSREKSCLYCIKELYQVNNTPLICSLKDIAVLHTDNRNEVLNSLVYKYRENMNYKEICHIFNTKAQEKGIVGTSPFEIEGIDLNIMPNTVYINSIAASFVILYIDQIISNKTPDDDYIFVHLEESIYIERFIIQKSPDCFLCNG